MYNGGKLTNKVVEAVIERFKNSDLAINNLTYYVIITLEEKRIPFEVIKLNSDGDILLVKSNDNAYLFILFDFKGNVSIEDFDASANIDYRGVALLIVSEDYAKLLIKAYPSKIEFYNKINGYSTNVSDAELIELANKFRIYLEHELQPSYFRKPSDGICLDQKCMIKLEFDRYLSGFIRELLSRVFVKKQSKKKAIRHEHS